MEKMKELKNKFMEKFYLEGGLNQIWEWVEQELDKARKEGEGRILESIRMLNAIWSIYFASKIYTKQDIFNHIDSFLSKLKE